MYSKLYCCRIKTHLKDKQLLFWSFLFPILLGTLLFLAFGTSSSKEMFQTISVAYVTEQNTNAALDQMLEVLSSDKDSPLLNITTATQKEAENLLLNEEVSGIIRVSDQVELIVKKEGIHESILKNIMDNFIQLEQALQETEPTDSLQYQKIISYFSNNTMYTQEISLTEKSSDATYNYSLQYFYAVIALACLYCSFYGLDNAVKTQANFSSLAARRSVAPVNKLSFISAEFLASLTIQLIQITLQMLYFIFVLGIDFGDQIGHIALICLIGSIVGISYGSFIGFILPTEEGPKTAVLISTTLFFSFLGGLMFANMIDIIEQYVPIINWINPAALISRMFFAINVYDNNTLFFQNFAALSVLSLLFIFGSFLVFRRKKYASI